MNFWRKGVGLRSMFFIAHSLKLRALPYVLKSSTPRSGFVQRAQWSGRGMARPVCISTSSAPRHSPRTLAMNATPGPTKHVTGPVWKPLTGSFWKLFAFVWVAVSGLQLAAWDNRATWDGDRPPPLFLLQLSFTLSGG